jgi:hypothetical protein
MLTFTICRAGETVSRSLEDWSYRPLEAAHSEKREERAEKKRRSDAPG